LKEAAGAAVGYGAGIRISSRVRGLIEETALREQRRPVGEVGSAGCRRARSAPRGTTWDTRSSLR